MAIVQIETWLNGPRPYESGKALYLIFGKEESFKRQLEMVETSFLRKKLIIKLTDLSKSAKQLLQTKNEAETKQSQSLPPSFLTKKKAKASRPVIIHNDLPPFLKKRDLEKAKCWKQLNELRHSLNPNTDVPEVLAKNVSIIKKIRSLDLKNSQIWKELNYWKQTGELLKREDEIDLPLHKLQRKLSNARSAVSKYKGVMGKEKLYQKHSKEKMRLIKILENVV